MFEIQMSGKMTSSGETGIKCTCFLNQNVPSQNGNVTTYKKDLL